MRDFNFFSPYIEVKRDSKIKLAYVLSALAISISVFGGFYVWSSIKISNLQNTIDLKYSYIQSEEVKQRIKEANEMKRRLEVMQKYSKLLDNIHTQINEIDIISSDLILDINSNIPKDIYFNVFSIDQDNIQIQGQSDSRISIAELQYNLKSIENLEDIYIIDISYNEELKKYDFILKSKLKAGNTNEAD